MTTANTKRTKAPVEGIDNETAPMVPVIRTKKDAAQRVHLFSLEDEGGNEEKFYGRASVSWVTSLKAAEIFASKGEAAAQAFAIKALIGQAGFDRLMAIENLDEDDFRQVLEYITTVVVGPAGRGKASKND